MIGSEENDLVYCVCCGFTVQRQEAELVFRTGFYRNRIPLACCRVCMREQEEDESRLMELQNIK